MDNNQRTQILNENNDILNKSNEVEQSLSIPVENFVNISEISEKSKSFQQEVITDMTKEEIKYTTFEKEEQMHDIIALIASELSEPYSIYTFRYFIYNWPHLCILATHEDHLIGVIICKQDQYGGLERGYIAMLAVQKSYRRHRVGTKLVEMAIDNMAANGADLITLETEMTNLPALRLYENIGFIRSKRLFRYYMNGVDAFSLKLYLK